MDMTILDYVFAGNKVSVYLAAFGWTFLGFIIVKIFMKYFLMRIKKFAESTETTIDDFLVNVIEKVAGPFLYFLVIYVSAKSIVLIPLVKNNLDKLALAILAIFIARFIIMFSGYAINAFLQKKGSDATLGRSLQGALVVVRVLVWGVAVILFLDNMGFKVSAVLAGLGVGGIAVALAAQTVLKDLFSYFSIIFDHPFKIGDFIIIGDFMGTIEHIGIKTSRIRSLGGEMVIFPNSDLTESRVRNYKLMEKRRVVFKLGVEYKTKIEKVKEIPNIVKRIISDAKGAEVDRAHFSSFGDFSLIFEVVYYVVGADYNEYMDIQQKINLGIKEEFEKRAIEFAFPSQTIYLENSNNKI